MDEHEDELGIPMGRRRSTSFIVEDHDSEEEIPDSGSEGSGGGDGELEPYIPPEGGRDRGTSIAFDSFDSGGDNGGGRSRGTSIAIQDDGTSESTEEMLARAANMSKIAARGGTHVGGVDFVPTPNPNKKAPQIKLQSGPCDPRVLGTLEKGLHNTGVGFARMLTEEQIEELMLVEQEQQKIKEEKEDAKESMASLAVAASKGKKKKTKSTKKMVTRARKNSSASRQKGHPLDKQEVGAELAKGRSHSDTPATTSSERTESTDALSMQLPSMSEPMLETAPASVVYKVKLLMLGDSGVGKTCLMRRFCTDSYNEHVLATAGVDFANKKMDIGGRSVEVQIWDTAGQERFHKITRSYFKGANGIILVYDVTKRESFANVGYWIRNIQEAVTAENMPAIILVANKTDLPSKVVDTEDGQAKAEEHMVKFFETSAKSGSNVIEALTECATTALQRKLIAGGIIPNPDDAKDEKKKCIVS